MHHGRPLIYELSLGEGNEDKGASEVDYICLGKMNECLLLIRFSYSTVIYWPGTVLHAEETTVNKTMLCLCLLQHCSP
jgi:hypothetical protein